MAYWYTFAETMERLDVSVIHLIRRDIIRAAAARVATIRGDAAAATWIIFERASTSASEARPVSPQARRSRTTF